jgi:hypothetical protein
LVAAKPATSSWFWAVAKASNRKDFNYYKAELALETPQGAKDITNTEPRHWARVYFEVGSMYESVDNNLCESFNYPIYHLYARYKLTISRTIVGSWIFPQYFPAMPPLLQNLRVVLPTPMHTLNTTKHSRPTSCLVHRSPYLTVSCLFGAQR